MLSNDALKLLKWLEKHDQWMTKDQIAAGYKSFDDRSFKAITKEGCMETRLSESEGSWAEYRINAAGKAYLEAIPRQNLREMREWVNFLIPVLTFLAGLMLSDPVQCLIRWIWELLT